MTQSEENLPEISPTDRGESASLRAMHEHFEPSFTVREELKNDYGVDGTIELRRYDSLTEKTLATNRRASFQLKHTSRGVNRDGSVSYPIETKNLNYLGARPPAFYVLYATRTKQLLFRWWQDIYEELLESHANWDEQTTINVRFSQLVDERAVDGIKITIDEFSEELQLLRNGPEFVRRFRGTQLPNSMLPGEPFYDRSEQLAAIASFATRGCVVPICGPAGSGKTEVIRHYLSSATAMEKQSERLGGPIALLAIDVGPCIGRRVLRAISRALGITKLDSLSEIGPENDPNRQAVRARILEETLPSRLRQLFSLTVIDNIHECFREPIDKEDFVELVNCGALRNGTTIVAWRGASLPDLPLKRIVQPTIHIDSLPLTAAQDLLSTLSGESFLASEVVREVVSVDEVLRPGVIVRGANLFKTRLRRSKDAPKKELLSTALFDAADDLFQESLAFLQCETIVHAPEALGPLGTLLVISIVPELPLRPEWLDSSVLPLSGLQSLVEFGWAEYADTYRLTRTAIRALRQELSRFLKDGLRLAEVRLFERGLKSLLMQTELHLAESQIELYERAIEEGLSWLRESVPTGSGIEAQLMAALLPHVIDDFIFPISEDELASVSELFRSTEGARNLDSYILDFVSAARFQRDRERFTECLRGTFEVAIQNPGLSSSQLKALDTAAFIGLQRHHCYREIFNARISLLPWIAKIQVEKLPTVAILKWSTSYILNTATIALALGDVEMARNLAEDGKTMLDRLPVPKTRHGLTDYSWLRSRLLSLEARLSRDPHARFQKFQASTDSALLCLANSDHQSHWVRFYLRRVRHLIEESWTDADRSEALHNLFTNLTGGFSDVARWPLDVRTQVAALCRDAASFAADPDQRLRSAQKGLDLLVPAATLAMATAKQGDTRSLLTLSRSYAFTGTCLDAVGEFTEAKRCLTEAIRFVSQALASKPSANAWELKLRLLDHGQLPNSENTWHKEPLATAKNKMTAELQRELEACGEWLDMQNSWGVSEGRLAIWCREREWQAQGSLEKWAATTSSYGRDWDSLDNESRRSILTAKHRKRQNQLLSIRSRTGPFVELLLTLARRESQYQRLIAIYGSHVYQPSGTQKYLKEAFKLWPDSHSILADEARIYRYVWDYSHAIQLFRLLVTSWPNGEKRRQATVDLIETLLTAAIHGGVLKMPDGNTLTHVELLSEAQALLAQVAYFRKIGNEVAILRDRVALEMGEDINWPAFDGIYELVVGGVNLYAPTIVKNLSELRAQESNLVEHITDLVRQDFTSPDVLRGMGLLYLRKAEKDASVDSVSDCQKAYAVFDACRILEEAFIGSGSETAITSYQRGRSILIASKIARNVNPFGAYLSGKKSLLHLADSLFQRAISLSVGSFHFEARQRASETARLIADFSGS